MKKTRPVKVRFAVITAVPDAHKGDTSNLYHATLDSEVGDVYIENKQQTKVRPMLHKDFVQISKGAIMLENFQLGQIVVVDLNGNKREIGGAERKVTKWGVTYELFRWAGQAAKRAQEVMDVAEAASNEH